jgi:hypothetical protein
MLIARMCLCLRCCVTQAVAAMRNVITQLLTQAHSSSTATLDSSSSSSSTSKELYVHQLATEVLQGMAEESGGVLTATYIQVRCCTALTSILSLLVVMLAAYATHAATCRMSWAI